MNAEQFLRKHFGLVGEYYTEEWKRMLAITDKEEREAVMDSILLEDSFDCKRQFTREAWEAWGKALEMFDDIEREGYLGSGSKGDYVQFFWECLPG